MGYLRLDKKVEDFLYEIGFDDNDIDEFCYIENDGYDAHGRPFYGNDVIFAKYLTEEKLIEFSQSDEIVEDYWGKGWSHGNWDVSRANFDSYKGNYFKAFPTRYKLWEFKFTKSLRRVLNKNRDLQTVIRPLRITPEKSKLHEIYNYARHGEMPRKSLLEMYKYQSNDGSTKMEVCVFKGEKLVACSFFEVGSFATYGNSLFWDLNEKNRSLGTLTFLLEVKYAQSLKMYYHYLGHFYAQNPAYHYKARFSGLELFDWDNDHWLPFKHSRTKELLKQKLPRHKDDEE